MQTRTVQAPLQVGTEPRGGRPLRRAEVLMARTLVGETARVRRTSNASASEATMTRLLPTHNTATLRMRATMDHLLSGDRRRMRAIAAVVGWTPVHHRLHHPRRLERVLVPQLMTMMAMIRVGEVVAVH